MLFSDLLTFAAVTCAAIIIAYGQIVGNRLRAPLEAFIDEVDQLTSDVAEGRIIQSDGRASSLSRTVQGWVAEASVGGRIKDAGDTINDTFVFADVSTIRSLEVLPSQVVGAGLFLTFTFLAIAIYTSGQAIGGDTAGLESAMRLLLSTAGAKFVTSIAAIGTSIFLVRQRTRLLALADQALGELARALDERFLRVPATDARIALALVELARAMTSIETQITKVLEERETVLASALSDAMAPVARSISTMTDTIATTNADAMAKMVSAFTQELGGATLRYNQDLADILRTTSEALQQAPTQMTEAARAMEQLIAAASQRTRLALDGAEVAFSATAAQLAAIAKSAAKVEQRLAGQLDAVISEGDAAAQRLSTIADQATAVVAGLRELDGRAKTMTETVQLATSAAALTAEVQRSMNRDMAEWTDGMAEVDAHVARLIARVEPAAREEETWPDFSSVEPNLTADNPSIDAPSGPEEVAPSARSTPEGGSAPFDEPSGEHGGAEPDGRPVADRP